MSKTVKIYQPGGLIVPGSLFGLAADVSVPAGSGIKVPLSYGNSLIEDRLALKVDPESDMDILDPSTDRAFQEEGDEAADETGLTGDAYDTMSEEELRDIGKYLGVKSWHVLGVDKLRPKIREAYMAKFSELTKEAEELGLEVSEDWTLEELEEKIQDAKDANA